MFIRAALSCMALALVEHTFMTTEPDDHEWRYGHGDTLHGLYFSLPRFHTQLQSEECLHCTSFTEHYALPIKAQKLHMPERRIL